MTNPVSSPSSSEFVDRRNSAAKGNVSVDRRQFGSSYDSLSDEGREFALAIDNYKVQHGRRFINFDEMLDVLRSLGYRRP